MRGKLGWAEDRSCGVAVAAVRGRQAWWRAVNPWTPALRRSNERTGKKKKTTRVMHATGDAHAFRTAGELSHCRQSKEEVQRLPMALPPPMPTAEQEQRHPVAGAASW